MDKYKLCRKAINYLGAFNKKIKTKFDNVCGKTGQYNVPEELFQKRTSRKNRVLISWKTVKNNNLTIEQLESFTGGVAVEFVNEDFFEEANQTNPVFVELKNRLGSNEKVSSIITIRSESGSSSSFIQRLAFEKLVNNTTVNYNGQTVIINKSNYKEYGIKRIEAGETRIKSVGIGNEKWTGFLFVSIKGGQQDVIESHSKSYPIFNPACEFADDSVSCDLNLVMAYFAFLSIDKSTLSSDRLKSYEDIILQLEEALKTLQYDNNSYSGNLYDYCINHPSVKMVPGKLYDPVQVEEIHIQDFAIDNKEDPRNLDFTHNEAVNKDKYYWDNINKCILSPARPTNVFWSKHLSNMMQQNFSLDEYFKHEEEILKRRKLLLAEDK